MFALTLAGGLVVALPFAIAAFLLLDSARTSHDEPRVPADVDLQQAVATTTAITDAGPQLYRAGRARGYARSRV